MHHIGLGRTVGYYLVGLAYLARRRKVMGLYRYEHLLTAWCREVGHSKRDEGEEGGGGSERIQT